MECPNCGRWHEADRQTGFDADMLCPVCIEEDAMLDAIQDTRRQHARAIVDRAALAHQSALQDLATIASEAAGTTDRARLWELLEMARELETRARVLTDDLFARVERVIAQDEETESTESPF